MTRPLSADLRERIVKAVEEEGMTRRAAARRFGVAPSSAVHLVSAWRASGSITPRRQGGDRRSGEVEAHAEALLAMIASEPDLTLAEIAERLQPAAGKRFVASVLWRFFARRRITFKKNGARQRTAAP